MTAELIDGKAIAGEVIGKIKTATAALKRRGTVPGLAVVLVGDDPASRVYVASKGRRAEECGFKSVQHTLPENVGQTELLALVESLNRDPSIHGILVQLPLPKPLAADVVIQSIRPDKDVDGLHVVNAGKVMTGDIAGSLVSCTPAGAMLLLRRVCGDDFSGRNATVIGRSNLFGKPMSSLLLAANATVTTAHSRTRDLAEVCRTADILVAAVGRPEMVKGSWIRPGAVVIDVGINRVAAPEKGEGKTRLVGDVDFAEAREVASAITPVPGGVGPMTIAMLMANTLIAACRAAGLPDPVL